MDPWRDYRKYTDWALDAFIKTFPKHPDHALALSEAERRRKDREQRDGAKNNQKGARARLLGKEIPGWAKAAAIIASIVFVLAILYLALQFFLSG